MKARISRIGRYVLALLVTASLAFGAREAFAATAGLVCEGGTCTTNQECQNNCDRIFGDGARTGRCTGLGCCRCLL